MNECKAEALLGLENEIDNGRKVLIFDCDDLAFLGILRKELMNRNSSNVDIWQCIDGLSDYVLREKIDAVLDIYRMYDFSDKVLVVSDSNQYGSLFNYVKTGILTKQEMVDALLYKI